MKTDVVYDHLQFLMCTVNVSNATVLVSAATGRLEAEPFEQRDLTWQYWEPTDLSLDPLLNVVTVRHTYIPLYISA